MLLILLLVNIKILSCLFFLVILSNFLVIPVVRQKNKLKLALDIPTGAPTILVNEQIDIPPLAALKTIKTWSI